MDRAFGVFLLLLCGIAIGAGGSQLWQISRYADALDRERGLIAERDRLVAELATVRDDLKQAQSAARAARKDLYATDQTAADWAAAPVPAALAARVRDAARAADAASGAAPELSEADTAAR